MAEAKKAKEDAEAKQKLANEAAADLLKERQELEKKQKAARPPEADAEAFAADLKKRQDELNAKLKANDQHQKEATKAKAMAEKIAQQEAKSKKEEPAKAKRDSVNILAVRKPKKQKIEPGWMPPMRDLYACDIRYNVPGYKWKKNA